MAALGRIAAGTGPLPTARARLRAMALLPLGAYAVHQGRYYAAFGGHTDRALAGQGHAYLGSVALVAALLVAIVAGELLLRLARAWDAGEQHDGDADVGTLKTWLVAGAALAAIYVGQELLEGLLATGHPGGLAGVFGAGGWMALPLALAVGGLIALALRGAGAIVAIVAGRRASGRPRAAAALAAPRRVRRASRRRSPIARRQAGRAPPPLLAPLT